MQDVKIFLAPRVVMPPLEERLQKYGIPIYDKVVDCDVAIILHGAVTNPLAFKKPILAYWVLDDGKLYSIAFIAFYLPILKEYYDDVIDLTRCKDFDEIGDELAKEVKRLENETD